MDEFNNNVISYKVNKPLLDETLRLNIDFSIKDYENPKFYDKLRTSNLIYNLIMSSQFENYIIETSEDEIKIIPYIKSKE